MTRSEVEMIDAAYVVGSALFFMLMLAYVRGCAFLGRETGAAMASAEADAPQ